MKKRLYKIEDGIKQTQGNRAKLIKRDIDSILKIFKLHFINDTISIININVLLLEKMFLNSNIEVVRMKEYEIK